MSRPTWDEYFMSNAVKALERATCERLRVGAVIVVGKSQVATGYNGSNEGEPHCIDEGCLIEKEHCIRTIHAERNALAQCTRLGISTEGATIYVTHFPCLDCTKQILRSGIKKIVYQNDYKNHWYAKELIERAGVELVQMP